ncbi:MAG: hypothetical protein QOI12_3616 [Alphaproteobacteria bacterium]|nr:hypothetical protein [Alphaproteobacteria bacterium]
MSVQRLKSGLLNLLTVIASVAVTLLVAEVVLRFLPVAAALPVEPPTAANPIQRYVANQPFTWSFDWNLVHAVRGRSNAQGFLADYDYDAADPRPLVAVVGDSFIEALRVPFPQSLTGRLQAALGARGRAYAFAQSGSPLSQYVAYARHACAVYRPQRMVVSVVGNDFDESLYANRRRNGIFHLYPRPDGGFDHKLTPLPPPGLAERVTRRSALALYLMRNVGISNLLPQFNINLAQAAPATAPYVGQTGADADPTRIEEGHRVIDWFLDELPRSACLPARDIVIVIDAPRPQVYSAADLAATKTSYFGQMRSRLISEATARGFKVVDTEPHFVAAYAADHALFEHPTDGHWNEHGHEVVASAVRQALADWPQ